MRKFSLKHLKTILAMPAMCLGISLPVQAVDVPASIAVSPAVDYPGGSLKGEYWHRPTASILTDGAANRANGIDNQINGFGTADGTFKATKFVYLGNDLDQVQTWLGSDAASFIGTPNNIDDGAFRFRGYINIAAPGNLNIGTISDDGSRITIGGIDIINNDGSHGDATVDADVNFLAAGLYPIEVTYFSGDWTSDGNNHSGSTDPALHGGDNFHLRIGGADITAAGVSMLHPSAPAPALSVGLNFGADEVPAQGASLAPTDVAGVLPQANWNNLNANNGSASALVANQSGAAVPTTIAVTWASPNTWSSTGRGEEFNNFPAGGDRTLMTGFLDTGDNSSTKATVTVTGIPAEFTSGGYDVIVYCSGGVGGRGGAYTINGETKFGTAGATAPDAHVQDAGANKADVGTYVRFNGQFSTSFTLEANADAAVFGGDNVNFRAPINAIQIIKSRNPDAGIVRGYLTKKRYENIGSGVALADLLTNPKYINNTPDFTCLRPDFSANDADECDNCGMSVSGYFIPTASGPHIFHISADDGAGLFLSTDENPANKVQIASEPAWTGRRNYVGGDGDGTGAGRGDPPVNISAPINLVAGNKYYIEGALKEGGGGDNFDAAVQGPGDAPVADGDRPIFGSRIATRVDLTGSSLAITTNPLSSRVPEGDAATFTVVAAAVSPLCGSDAKYQWLRNGAAIPGANSATYTFGPVRVDDHLSTYSCVVSIPGVARTSASATLEVLGRECLRVVAASGSADMMHVNVAFSTFIDQGQATLETFAYTIPGLNVSGVEIGGDGKSVILTTDAQTENTPYVVSVDATVTSLVGSPTCDAPNNQATFTSWVTTACGGVELSLWNNIGGTALIGMTSLATYPNSPDEVRRLTTFDTGADFAENYGGRLRGLFIPPVSGAWNLYVTADDASQLYFNANGPSAAGAVLVNEETGCCTAISGRRAGPFNLVAGQGYYIEGIYKEGGGGDYMRVGARLASDTTTVIAPMPPGWTGYPAAPAGIGGVLGISQHPASVTVLQNVSATFTVGFSNPNGLPVCIQWYRDGVAIDGANKASYSLPLVTLADNGAKFSVTGSIIGSPTITSTEATLTVSSDVVPPTCVAASGSANFSTILVTFSELVDKTSAETTFSYTISPLVDVASATLQADGKSVLLSVTPALTPDTEYTVTTVDVADLALNPQAGPCSKTFHSYKLSCGFLNFAIFYNMGGTAVSGLTGDPRYPNSPDERRYLTSFNTGPDFAENYGGNITGFFIPPTSGDWIFYIRSDDASELWFDKNDGAGLAKVQEETGCCGAFSGHATAPITLVAGEKYPIQVLYKEGGGGDYAQVAARMASDLTSALVPISGAFLAGYADPSGVSLAITQQPADQSFLIIAPTAGGAAPILDQNFNTDGGFTASGAPAAFTGAFAHDVASGSWQVNAVDTEISVPYTSLLSSPAVTVGRAGYVYLNFSHRWSVEGDNWDGCAVQVSVNGGAFTKVPGSSFSTGGYNGTVRSGNSILQNQEAFVGTSDNHQGPGYVNSAASLGYFNAGDNVVVRFVYGGDTNTKGPNTPSWEVTSVKLTDGNAPSTVTFATAATAVVPGNANPPISYQWYRNGSAIIGANSASYTFTPVLSDNGNKYSCNLYTLGAQDVTREATLTVAQPNTPPTFACGPNVAGNEDGGAASIVWATDIKNHSIARVATAYANDFSSGAAGMTLAGVLPGATVEDGVLKLTVPNNSAYGAASISASLVKYESLEVSWKSRVGGGAGGGADGYSLNIGTDVPADPGYGGEEGIGTGLSVTVDTFDNGTGEDVGVDIKWGGARVAYVNIPKDDDGSGNFIRKDTFVDAHLTLTAAGVATVTYDGNTISGTIPGYAGIEATRALFWARTGGANDNQWVDDFTFQGFPYDLSSSESSQTVQFNVSNDNPSLFSVQPAIGADGTLTYTPAANASGVATVTVVAQDSGGTANGGRDTSAPCTFVINIGAVNDCPVAGANQSLTTLCQAAVSVTLSGTDIDGDALSYVISGPANGTLSGTAPNVTYTPNAGFGGATDSFSYVVYDGQCRSEVATVTIAVGNCSTPPTAVIGTEALVDFTPDFENPVLISCNWWNACLVLDGWTSSASNGGALTYLWFDELEPVPFDSGVVTTNCYEVGTHTITLIVEDSNGLTGTDSKTIEVLTAPLAIELLIEKVNQSRVTRSIKRELVASLRVALDKSKDEKIRQTQQALDVFEKKVRAKVAQTWPEYARVWIKWSQSVSTGMDKCIKPPRKAKDHYDDKKDRK